MLWPRALFPVAVAASATSLALQSEANPSLCDDSGYELPCSRGFLTRKKNGKRNFFYVFHATSWRDFSIGEPLVVSF